MKKKKINFFSYFSYNVYFPHTKSSILGHLEVLRDMFSQENQNNIVSV